MRTFTVLLTMVACAAGLLAEDHANLLEDPSFEKAEIGKTLPSGWDSWQPEGSKFTASVDADAHTGKRSLKIEGTGRAMVLATRDFPIKPGDRYLFGGYLKVTGTEDGFLRLDLRSAAGDLLGCVSQSQVKAGTNGWQSIVMLSKFDEYPKAAHFKLVSIKSGDGALWLDDVTLIQLPPLAKPEMVPNGDMELSLFDNIAGWSVNRDPTTVFAMTSTRDAVKNGKTAMKLHATGSWASANSTVVNVDPSKKYRASVWVKVVKGAAHLQLSYWNGHQWLGGTDSKQATPGEWQRLTVDADMTKFKEINRLHLAITVHGPETIAFADDAVLDEIVP